MAFDPGPEPGWAKFNSRGEILDLGIVRNLDSFPDFLEMIPRQNLEAAIYEEYKQLPGRTKAVLGRKKNKVPTVECIGHIRSWALRYKLNLIPQPPQILAATQKHTQVFLPSDHSNSHHIAAFLHGSRWLIDQGIMKTALEMEHEAIEKTRARVIGAGPSTGGARRPED
jgi:hypothetical protein